MYEHDLRPEELLDGDVEAILIFLRNSSFGSGTSTGGTVGGGAGGFNTAATN